LNKVRIICRSSRLSLLQAELVRQKILSVQPVADVEIIAATSRGDRELHLNLSVLDGTDFFTEEIFNALERNEADIAVHSLKDMSADHFFSHDAFAVVDRDDVRDIAIFNPGILEKIERGEKIVVGTCSPRREEMAIDFLKKALPQLNTGILIETKPIRGNVEARLKQLDDGDFDATILATAGLNRLLKSIPDAANIKDLLLEKRLMLLPLIECVPAPCQGAIVAEAHPSNKEAVALIKKINNTSLFENAFNEKKEAFQYGTGCLQKFGVTTIITPFLKTLFAAGENNQGVKFSRWSSLPEIELNGINLFSTTDFMKDFFSYEWTHENVRINQPIVFIANYKAVQQDTNGLLHHGNEIQQKEERRFLADKQKILFASGTKTWFELAKQGFWVQGCADAMGFEYFLTVLQMPLFKIHQTDVCILTHEEAAERWKNKGFHAVSNYRLKTEEHKIIKQKIAAADFIFWSSFSQFKYYRQYCKSSALHACAGGETASLLKIHNIDPILFPTIKSFEQWRKSSTLSHSVG